MFTVAPFTIPRCGKNLNVHRPMHGLTCRICTQYIHAVLSTNRGRNKTRGAHPPHLFVKFGCLAENLPMSPRLLS